MANQMGTGKCQSCGRQTVVYKYEGMSQFLCIACIEKLPKEE